MTATDTDQTQNEHDDVGTGGPGAPTPLTALEVLSPTRCTGAILTCIQGVAGLTKRDITLITDAGYYTVEAVAYTYASMIRPQSEVSHIFQATTSTRTDQRHLRAESNKGAGRRYGSILRQDLCH
jgi:hypothetical protein